MQTFQMSGFTVQEMGIQPAGKFPGPPSWKKLLTPYASRLTVLVGEFAGQSRVVLETLPDGVSASWSGSQSNANNHAMILGNRLSGNGF